MANVLITGMSGGLSQRVAERLLALGHEVVGADYRDAPPTLPRGVIFYKANYNKTRIEDVFKRHKFHSVLHLGRVGNLKEDMGKRFDLNVVGSQKIMNLCVQHEVHRLVVLSTFHIYGAHPSNHIPVVEEDPLRAGSDFPQIADAIQLDNMACTWTFQHRKVRTAVLRPTNVVGPNIHNAMSKFLRQVRVPYLSGFNPMMQFIHEDDVCAAVLAAHGSDVAGVYNVAGMGEMPWLSALKLAKARPFGLLPPLISFYLNLFSSFPEYLVNFFRFPCVISDARFRTAFGWKPAVTLEESIWSTVAETRLRLGQHGVSNE